MTSTDVATTELSPSVALDTLLINQGDMALTIENLGVSRAVFIRALTAVPTDTYQTLRLAAAIQAFSTLHDMTTWLAGKSDDMDGSEVARALTSMMGHMETITRPAQTTQVGGSTINVMVNSLPREAGNAVKGLASLDMDDLHGIRQLLKLKADGAKADDVTDGEYKEL